MVTVATKRKKKAKRDGGNGTWSPMQGTSQVKILRNAYETIVASGTHNYMQDPMNMVYRGQRHFFIYFCTS